MSTKKSNCKENIVLSSRDSGSKRHKMNENSSVSKNSVTDFDDDNTNTSVTIYEDEQDINYFNKSRSRPQLIPSSYNKRSPLAMLNRKGKYFPGTSTSSGLAHQMKIPAKLDTFKTEAIVDNRPDPFNRISDEILLHIFTFLPRKALHRVAAVNGRFNRVSKDETLWVRMDLGAKFVRHGAIGDIISRGLIILRLSQAKIQTPIFEPWFPVEQFQSKLQYLDLSMTTLDAHNLAQLLTTCRMLKKLSLEAVKVDDAVCDQISKNSGLEVLNLAMAEGLTKKGVTQLLNRLQCLVALNISWTNLDVDTVTAMVENLTAMMMRLNIAGCRKSLLDKHIKCLSERCPNIVELDVSDCTMLTSNCIPFISKFDTIEYLSLSRCYNISITSYLTLNTIKSLLYIDVFGLLSESGLQHMEKAFKNIGINKFVHSSVARPTVTPRRTSVWGIRTRD